jgi:hypothetical protein
MKKRAFFLASVPLAICALAAQAFSFFLIFVAVADAVGQFWTQTYFPQIYQPTFSAQVQPSTTQSFYWIVCALFLAGSLFALSSLASVILSFRRRESGWRFITVTLLLLYLGSWLPLVFRNQL